MGDYRGKKKTKPPAFQFYVKDWLSSKSVLAMSPAQCGYYINLLANAWDSDPPGTLPDNPSILWKLARAESREQFEDGANLVLLQFPKLEGRAIRHHPKLTALWKERKSFIKSRREAGLASIRSKRMAEARSKGTHSKEQWLALVSFCKDICVKCGRTNCHLDKDHITPVYQGGSDSINNIQPLCAWCNAGKGPESIDYRPEGWLTHVEHVLGAVLNSASSSSSASASVVHHPPTPQGGIGAFILPDWVPKEPWDGFIEMRKSIHKQPKTARALHLLVGKLERLKAGGHDPGEVLNQSTMNGWQGLFELKAGKNGTKPEPILQPEKPKTREELWETWKLWANGYGHDRAMLEKRVRLEFDDYKPWLQERVKKYLAA